MALLTASWVVTSVGPALRDGRVRVEDGRVVAVGEAGDPALSGPARDLGAGVLMPGLINAHCHLELSYLRGRVHASSGFVPWVESLLEARAVEDPARVRAGVAEAVRQLQATGTVAVGDVSNQIDHIDLLRASGLTAVVFYELLGWDPARAARILEAAHDRLASLPDAGSRVEVRLAAHAPHSVSPALFAGLRALGGPAALHLAESQAESRYLAAGNGEWAGFLERRGLGGVPFGGSGLSPVGYAASLGVLRPGLVAAHCVNVDAADRETLARAGVHVAVCPRSNRRLGLGLPPVRELLEAKVPLCLGTDSLASVETLDLMDDVVALHRELPRLEPKAIVDMATAGGAAALGLPDLGTIAPGQRAALVHAAAERPPRAPYQFLVSGEARPRPVEP